MTKREIQTFIHFSQPFYNFFLYHDTDSIICKSLPFMSFNIILNDGKTIIKTVAFELVGNSIMLFDYNGNKYGDIDIDIIEKIKYKFYNN